LASSVDDELGDADMEAAPELDYQLDRRRWGYVWLLIPTAVCAVTLAVIWPNNALQLWSSAQSLISFSAQQTTSSPRPLIAVDALKDEISELRYQQQKISAELTALRSAQQELQLSSVKATYWYSEPNALLHQQVASKPKAAALSNTKSSTQPRAAPLEANAEPRNGTVPLPLARSQTTAPNAVPIR
jgi:hypothetical protein